LDCQGFIEVLLLDGKIAVVDVESTCIRGAECRIVSIALIPLNRHGLDLGSTVYAVEPPGVMVGETALVHGVTSSDAPGPRPNASLREAVRLALGYTLVVYGAHDVALLLAEAQRQGLRVERVCYVDLLGHLLSNPLRRQRAVELGGYPLEAAVRDFLGVELPKNHFHDPLCDALYTGLLYQALLRRGEKLRVMCRRASPTAARGLRGIVERLASLLPLRR